jgi:hypothetical protein
MSDLKIPTNNRYVDSKKKAQGKVENAFNDFKALMNDKTHPDNQTPGYKNNVVSTLNRLLSAADEMDSANPGEGIFGLVILCLRSSLKLRDDGLRMEVEIRSLKREIGKLKEQKRS